MHFIKVRETIGGFPTNTSTFIGFSSRLSLGETAPLNSKPITAAEKMKHRFSFTDRPRQNQTDATKTSKSPFKAVKVIRKGRERKTVNGAKCIQRFKVAFTTKFSKLWSESGIHRESEGLHGKCASLQTSQIAEII